MEWQQAPLKSDMEFETLKLLDRYVAEEVRIFIEQTYYAEVNRLARMETAVNDPLFLADPLRHLGLFTDHGVVHVRDVATQIIHVIDTVNGVLIAARERKRLEFMKGLGVMLAYLHDVGMSKPGPMGRAMHPEFAAQLVFSELFDDVIETLWSENSGNMAWRLQQCADQGLLNDEPRRVLREILSLSVCHSKSKVPIALVNDPRRLAAHMRVTLTSDLEHLHHQQQVRKLQVKLEQAAGGPSEQELLRQKLGQAQERLVVFQTSHPDPDKGAHVLMRHRRAAAEAFLWLEEGSDPSLVDDVRDTLRALRAADALRKRGTVLKTSGGYEIFVDQGSANAIYALRMDDDAKLFLLEADFPINAGEANLASSELTRHGELRVSLHHGSFASEDAMHRAARNAALIIHDIRRDAIDSFIGAAENAPDGASLIPASGISILVEETSDNAEFSSRVCRELKSLTPKDEREIRPAPSLQDIESGERDRYLAAREFDWPQAERRKLLERFASSGCRLDGRMNQKAAFVDVRLATVYPGEVLLQGGSRPGFVYIPLDDGLKVLPLGGYHAAPARPWVPLGNTGVIRGAARNASVVAERHVNLVMIPKEVYLKHWHYTYSPTDLTALFGGTE